MSIDEIRAQALHLSTEARARLTHELLASLDSLSEAEIEKLWIDEAMRRDTELNNGTAESSPVDEAFRRIRAGRK